MDAEDAIQQTSNNPPRKSRSGKSIWDVIEHVDPGRNDPCPCNSGRKFKYCHLAKKKKREGA